MTDSTGTLSCGPRTEALCLPGNPRLDVEEPLPLPGVIIFVHGVNSMGEWFDTAEQGICKGLNARLQRTDDHVHRIKGSGQLQPASYLDELTEDGYISRELKATSFIGEGIGNSPVIRFRWGYKASVDEANSVGGDILLDEKNAWGGGPFVNGCSALPDVFDKGSDAEIAWGALAVNHIQTSDRQVYSAPARYYQAFAAWRLAKLVARIREVHREFNHCGITGKDCPITIVCHSQGNMIGLTSAYFGARHSEFNGLGVADNYVLACAPYSLRKSWMDNFSQYDSKNEEGRVTYEARVEGLKNFFDIVRRFGKDKAQHYDADFVDQEAFNRNPKNGETPYASAQDRKARDTRARAFLYCSPHDRVISVAPVRGMGWLGMSKEDVKATNADGVLYQRVWAEVKPGVPYKVGEAPGKNFRYWDHTTGAGLQPGVFWAPDSERASVQFRKIWGDSRKSFLGKLFGSFLGLFVGGGAAVASSVSNYGKVNGVPDKDWAVPVNAPEVPCGGIEPRAVYLPRSDGSTLPTEQCYIDGVHTLGPFNVHYESARDALNPTRQFPEGSSNADAYAQQRQTGHGSAASEAAMRYDQNAGIRQRARREAYNDDGTPQRSATFTDQDIALMNDENHHKIRGTEFGKFEEEARAAQLKEGDNQQPTNHSTILTNPAHAEHVLAYDVDVGVCLFSQTQMNQFRRMADWRWCKPRPEDGDVYPGDRDPKNDNEYEYYNTADATVKGGRLENDARFNAALGAVTDLKIPDERNKSRWFGAQHLPDDLSTRHA